MTSFGGLKTGGSYSFSVVKIGDVEFTCKDEADKPLKDWYYVLITADGKKKKGKLDANGHAKVEKIANGESDLTISQDKPKNWEDEDPPPPPPPAPLPPPGVDPPSPSKKGDAGDKRKKKLDDKLNDVQPPTPGAPEPDPPKHDPLPKGPGAPVPNSPEEMRQRYLTMSFKVGDEDVSFSLDALKYHNNTIQDQEPKYIGNREDLKQRVINLKKKLKQEKGEAFYAEFVGRFAEDAKLILPYPFFGKGSPAQIEAVLKIVGFYKGAGLGQYWNDKGSLSESLKDFYLHNMGLDCSGFAGNYVRWIAGGDDSIYSGVHHAELNPELPIPEFARRGKKRTSLDDIKMGDLIVWASGSHIATIQSHNGGGELDCVESNGDPVVKGLGHKTRKVVPSGGDLWTLGGSESVYIVSVA